MQGHPPAHPTHATHPPNTSIFEILLDYLPGLTLEALFVLPLLNLVKILLGAIFGRTNRAFSLSLLQKFERNDAKKEGILGYLLLDNSLQYMTFNVVPVCTNLD